MIFFSQFGVYGDWDGVMREEVMETHRNPPVERLRHDQVGGRNASHEFRRPVRNADGARPLIQRLRAGEEYSNYRSVNCLFCYRALHDLPYTVYLDHHRSSTYVTDAAFTLGNIVDNFIPGEVYNVGSTEYHDIKRVSDLVLNYLGKDDRCVIYRESEPFTTRRQKD